MMYVFRMFGIRTVLIGAELLIQTGDRRAEATRAGRADPRLGHAGGFHRHAQRSIPENGRIIVRISAVNTLLAIIANR